jgi:hypothetical protein
MKKHTIQFVSSSDIVNHFVPQQNIEHFYDAWCDHWTWGDTMHSLVGNNEFLYTLRSFLEWLNVGIDSEKLEAEYWELVGRESFIDLET